MALHSVLALLLAGLLAAHSRQAAAEEDTLHAARVHFQAGEQYYVRGRYEEAIREFKEAHRLSSKPALLYNIAEAYERLGDLEQARDFLEQYLASGSAAADEAEAIREKIKVLEERIARMRAADQPQETAQPQQSASSSPPSRQQQSQTQPSQPAPSKQEPTQRPVPQRSLPQAPSSAVAQSPANEEQTRSRAPPSRRSRVRTLKWASAAVGGTLLIASGVFAIDAGRMETKIEQAQSSAETWTELGLQSYYDRGERDDLLAWITGGAGIAILVTGGVLAYFERELEGERSQPVVLIPVLSPNAAGANVVWKW
ncbi:MAG: tetratricopeptide repeat protein [Pseudomonadota bacterium]